MSENIAVFKCFFAESTTGFTALVVNSLSSASSFGYESFSYISVFYEVVFGAFAYNLDAYIVKIEAVAVRLPTVVSDSE